MLVLLSFGAAPIKGQNQSMTERIAFAAYRNGQWDIYSIAPDGSDPRQLTNDAFEDTDPAYAPDGTKVAFASRRNGNWDVYVLDLVTGEETRLTSWPHYDGAPTWSPDGEKLAYESYKEGNLDIWQIDVAGIGPATNLTADSLEGDFAPAWSPNGHAIAFTSWRKGNKDLFLLEVDSNRVTHLTDTPAAEEWPTWHPDGDQLAFVIDDLGNREIFSLDVANPPTRGGSVQPVTWLGRSDGPVWSPAGDVVVAVFHRWDGQIITTVDPAATHQLPHLLTDVIDVQGRPTWNRQAVDFGSTITTLTGNGVSAPYEEEVTLNVEASSKSFNLVRFNDLEVGTPWLADTVDDSFQAWRFRLRDEVGYDFLGTLSDASRDIGAYTETSQYASWHKSGRAVDTLFDYHLGGQLAHEIIREDYSGETYWRIFLRCVDQTGECGRPVAATPWNYSGRARARVAPEQGGIEKSNLSGYYVDMTALAREYGWERISSYDDNDYSWTWHFLAFEYWHYQKRLTNPIAKSSSRNSPTNWYQAMLDVYPPETVARFFNWEKMRAIGDDPHLIALKGVPLPLEYKPWWALIEQ